MPHALALRFAPLLVASLLLQAGARRQLDKRVKASKKASKIVTDEFYASILALRAEPVSVFLGHATPKFVLPITSVNEDKFLKLLRLPVDERCQIEGLLVGRSSPRGTAAVTEEQQVSHALVRLARDPPPAVGELQRRTAKALTRPYPLGSVLRDSSRCRMA